MPLRPLPTTTAQAVASVPGRKEQRPIQFPEAKRNSDGYISVGICDDIDEEDVLRTCAAPFSSMMTESKPSQLRNIVSMIKRRLRNLLQRRSSSKNVLLVVNPWLCQWLKEHNNLRDWERELACSLTLEEDASLHLENFMILDNCD